MDLSKNKSLRILLTMIALMPLRIWAGEATLTGYGEAEAPPEFITVMVRVSSECYPSATVVSTTNDNLANKVLEAIKAVSTRDNEDEITATGGYVIRNTGYYSETRKPICLNTFKKINQIQFKTKEVAKFAEIFATLQDKIYGLGMETTPGHIESPTSYLEISSPIAGLSLKSQKTIERQALGMALQDAKDKFESTIALAGVKKYRIVNYSEQLIMPRHSSDESRDGGRAIAAPAPAPIEIGNLILRKTLNVRFEYIGDDLNLSF